MQNRISYRIRQFWHTVFIETDVDQLKLMRGYLTIEQWSLFNQLQPGEKNHAIMVFTKLLDQGDDQRELLTAALLHDIGKLRYHLNPIEKAVVVLIKAIHPGLAHRWGSMPVNGWDGLPRWCKAFILAENHAEWGADLARQAGASPMIESLIRRHHAGVNLAEDEAITSLLRKLETVDNDS